MYIHNVSGQSKTYQERPIADGAFQDITAHYISYRYDVSVLADISAGDLRISSDGITDVSTDPAQNINRFLGADPSLDPNVGAIAVTDKLGPDGTHKQIITPEIDMQGWVHEKDADNQDLNYMTFEYYKSDGSGGFTSQTSADSDTIRTIAHWEPPYTYHIVSGTAELLDTLGTGESIYLNLQGLRGNLAGEPVYNFVQGGIRMRPDRIFGLQSNSSREMPYVEMDLGSGTVSLHTNRLSFIFDYTAGINPKVQILITRMIEPGK